MKRVLIVVGIYKGKEFLPDLVRSLDNISYSKDFYKIYIRDDVSPDDTFEYLKNLVSNTKNPEQFELDKAKVNGGFDVNYNVGMQKAINENYDYVYILNQDTEVPDNFIQPLVEAMENDKNVAFAQSKILYHSDKTILNSCGNVYHFLGFAYAGCNLEKDKLSDKIKDIAYPSGAGMMMRVETLREIGLFEEELWMYHEDVYLGLLAHYYDKRVVIVPKSEIYHKYEFSSSIGRIDFMERNRFLILLWFYKWKTLFVLFPALFLMEFGQWFFAFYRGTAGKRFQGLKYFLSYKNWKKVLKIRRRIQGVRKVSDRTVLLKWASGKILHQELKNFLVLYVMNPFFNFYWFLVKIILWW